MAKPVQVWTLKSTYRQSIPDFSTTFPELPIVIDYEIFLIKKTDVKVKSIKVITLFFKGGDAKVYPVSNDTLYISNAVRATEERIPLALQHLEYTIMTEQNRAVLTQYAMNSTAILMERAVEIMNDNPESAGALKEIMEAYLDATGDSIRNFGSPKTRRFR